MTNDEAVPRPGTDADPSAPKLPKLLERMRHSPKSDWTASDVRTLCAQIGLIYSPPSRGSHFKVSSDRLSGTMVIPARRPIKPVYIKALVAFAQAHLAERSRGDAK